MMKKVNNREIWILLTFAIWLSTDILLNTTLESIFGIPKDMIDSFSNLLVSAMLVVQLSLFQTYKRKELLIIAAVTLLLLISAVNSHYLALMSTWLFIVTAKDIDKRQLIALAKRILQILIPLIILLYFVGVLENDIMYRNGEIRQSLGFAHPNQLGLRIFQWVACSIYLTDGKHIGISKMILYIILGIFIYLVPNSQSATACLFLLIIGILFLQILGKKTKWKKRFAGALLFGAFGVNLGSVFLSLSDISGNPFLKKIDRLLSIRFSAGHRVYELYGIKWLGQMAYVSEKEREMLGITEKLYLDNSYMTLLVRYGILVYLLFTVCFFVLVWKLYRSEQYKLLVILVTYSVYGIMENSVYMMTHNIFILTMGMVLYVSPRLDTAKEKRITNDIESNEEYGSWNFNWNFK